MAAIPTMAGFRAYLPEFSRLDDSHIAAHMDVINDRVKAGWWGDLYLEAYYLTLADSLSSSTRGLSAKGSAPGAETIYRKRLQALQMMLPKRGLVAYNRNEGRVL